MSTSATRKVISMFAALLVLAALPALAQKRVGKPGGGGSSIQWRMQITGHELVVLTVNTPDGETISREFGPGRDPSFELKDLESVEDGVYTYELRVVPKISENVKRKLVEARAKNDEKAARKIQKDAGLLQTVSESGAFTVVNRLIVNPDLVENDANDAAGMPAASSNQEGRSGVPGNVTTNRTWTPVVNDQVIPDDLIVQGSICVGFDCVNNESFGFDTIRMKENNLRIKAEDTSVGSFPTNDWQLTFNDSSSGGASKFSVEDITGARVPMTITAGAPTNSLFIDSTGRIGLRTATPVLDLHVSNTNTPGLRLEQTNAGGFTAQTWDIAGNEANFFVRDLTGGSRLPFRIRPGAPTSSIDIDSDGNVGIGTASPDRRLHVVGAEGKVSTAPTRLGPADLLVLENDENSHLSLVAGVNGGSAIRFLRDGSTIQNGYLRYWHDTDNLSVAVAGTERLRILADGNVGVGTATPSSKLHVDGGDIRVSGGSFIDDGATLNVPDYVFEESYRLMPLPQLAKFIETNRHLPNVPSASQVKEHGLNLSQMQMRLLEKLEELTLYTIEQNTTIEALKAQNEELRARLNNIEAQTMRLHAP